MSESVDDGEKVLQAFRMLPAKMAGRAVEVEFVVEQLYRVDPGECDALVLS